MNDIELDRLLDSWPAPAPSPALRASLRDRFPGRNRPSFGRPLRWVLAIAVASATLAIATEQSSGNPFGYIFTKLQGWYDAFMFGFEASEASAAMLQIRNSDPHMFVDGVPAPSPRPLPAARLAVDIPGDGTYQVILFPPNLNHGWKAAGSLHGNVLEFQAGEKHVRILCSRPVGQTWAVYIRRQGD